MKSVFTFLTSFGLCLILNLLYRPTTDNLDWSFVSAHQQTTIDLGDTVKWTWSGGTHNLISSSGVESFNFVYGSTKGSILSHTVNTIGQTSYISTPHYNQMYGSVVVTTPAIT